jgi:hypothetical protein
MAWSGIWGPTHEPVPTQPVSILNAALGVANVSLVGAAQGFDYAVRADGTVVITHHGNVAVRLRGGRAERFLSEVERDPQQVMARWTGNYKRGNERAARQHPRNSSRY